MEPLEVMLKRIEDLRRNLSAEIPEEGHYETRTKWVGGSRGGTNPGYEDGEEEVFVVDKPAEPNTQTREVARTQLQQVCDSSEWYSVRLVASRALGICVDNQIESWISELAKRLKETRTEMREVSEGGHYEEVIDSPEERYWRCGHDVWVPDFIEKSVEVPTENANNAQVDLKKMYGVVPLKPIRRRIGMEILQLNEIHFLSDEVDRFPQTLTENELIKIYREATHPYRIAAGRLLEYSPLRIWAHEHPVAATVTGIAALGTTSGLAYALIEYFKK